MVPAYILKIYGTSLYILHYWGVEYSALIGCQYSKSKLSEEENLPEEKNCLKNLHKSKKAPPPAGA